MSSNILFIWHTQPSLEYRVLQFLRFIVSRRQGRRIVQFDFQMLYFRGFAIIFHLELHFVLEPNIYSFIEMESVDESESSTINYRFDKGGFFD
jgi:hypothetical protein